jgi:alkylation response protein AidB-like acyl-CoA dehydrogenase
VHGGIGYTWEHDAHQYFRRASSLVAIFDANVTALDDVIKGYSGGVRRAASVDLPAEAETLRAEVREFRARFEALPAEERRPALVDSGYLTPHYPRPYGRGAGPVEQLVIEAELDGVELPELGIGAWILPTLIQCGTPEQLDRWVRPSLEGTLRWCQLFSEPGAGSDAAAIRSRARKIDGQKVWTSDALHCNRGLATVRTDPSAPKHAGVTMVVVDLAAEGVEIRPLREITGEALFNEVFLNDVFVPDADVVGEVGQGWRVARAALGNERVTIGSGHGGVVTAESLLGLLARHRPGDQGLGRDTARMFAEEQAMRTLNLRAVERQIAGESVMAEGNVTKLLSAEHAQRVSELGLVIAGAAGVSGAETKLVRELLFARCLTIGGGTSEISRNQIAERLLGLPRDPLLKR